MMNDWYVAKPEYADRFYGSHYPHPVTDREVSDLIEGWAEDEDTVYSELEKLDTSDANVLVRIQNSLDSWDTDILNELARQQHIEINDYETMEDLFAALQKVYPALSWFNEEFDWYERG